MHPCLFKRRAGGLQRGTVVYEVKVTPMEKRPPLFLQSAAVAALLALSACGGGGGGGGGDIGTAGSFSAPTPPPIVQPASNFETTEFNNAPGLAQINAQDAYARDATGSGVIVAVVDTGVTATHPDLAANMDPNSTTIVAGTTNTDYIGHGTAVAGVIAAVKDDVGMHGVAYDATILSVRVDDCDCPGSVMWDDNIAAGIDYAIDNGAKVINLSIGGPGGVSTALFNALVRASNLGIAVVASAGNDGLTQPDYPAALATDPRAGTTMVAVGSVDASNVISWFSHSCGDTATRCVVAPGEDVVTTHPDGVNYAMASGTSFSAPYVSGAIAVLMDAFPGLTAEEIIAILLQLTVDLGAPGVDSVYGQGLIDLQQAIAPSGTVRIPTGATAFNESISFADTSVVLGPAFGDSLSRYAASLNTVVLDDFRRAYRMSLSSHVATSGRELSWNGVLTPGDVRVMDLEGPMGLTLGVAVRDPNAYAAHDRSWFLSPAEETASESPVSGLTVNWAIGDDTELSFVHRLSADRLPSENRAVAGAGGLFLHARDSFAPYLGLMSTGTGSGIRHGLDRDTSVQFGWFDSDGTQDPDPLVSVNYAAASDDTLGSTKMAYGGFSHHLGSGVRLGLRFSHVDEDSRFLATRTTGAFGDGMGGQSTFLTASLSAPILARTHLVAGYTEAETKVDQNGYSILSDWSDIRANAFAAGVVTRDPFGAGGRLGLMAGQPLRVYSADATLTLAESVNADNTINIRSERVDMTPTGRELNLQLAYQTGLFDGGTIQGWIIGRLQPGHDRDAPPDYGAGVKMKIGF